MKINESIYDLYKKWNSGEKRKEDVFRPEFVDFGENTSVVWCVDNLVIDENGEEKDRFTFDEIKDYNNDGWRLPTPDEVDELDWKTRRIHGERMDDEHYYKIIDVNGGRLKIKDDNFRLSGRGFHLWMKKLSERWKNKALAYGFGYDMKFNIDSYDIYNNMMYVFLVKDKKKQDDNI